MSTAWVYMHLMSHTRIFQFFFEGLGCLDDEFRNNVLSRLEILTIDDEDTVRAEDRFKLDDVIDTALSIGQGSRSTYKSNSSRAGA